MPRLNELGMVKVGAGTVDRDNRSRARGLLHVTEKLIANEDCCVVKVSGTYAVFADAYRRLADRLNAEGKEYPMSDDELGLLDPMGGPPEDMEDVEPWWEWTDPNAAGDPDQKAGELEEEPVTKQVEGI